MYLPFPLENHRLSKVKHDMRKVMVGGLSHELEKEVKTMDPVNNMLIFELKYMM